MRKRERFKLDEPDPVLWTVDYARRITLDDVRAAIPPKELPSLTKQEAWERARAWLAAQAQQRRDDEMFPLMQHYAATH